jgi:HAE1 family hydrophobic/amphiphilic exporter-1
LLVGGYGHSLSTVFSNSFPTTQVQLRISLPIRNRAAEANLSNSLAEARRIRNQRQQTEQSIEASVRNAMQSVESAKSRLESSRAARESAEEQYQSEQRQFRAGTSTLFLVQQRQTDMITARSQERRAEADLGKAIATFELSTGTILQTNNIQLR